MVRTFNLQFPITVCTVQLYTLVIIFCLTYMVVCVTLGFIEVAWTKFNQNFVKTKQLNHYKILFWSFSLNKIYQSGLIKGGVN